MRRHRRINNDKDNILKDDNQKIIELIKKDKPFIISRLGIGSETGITYNYVKDKVLTKNKYNALSNNAGIYFKKEDEIIEFIKNYDLTIQNSNFLSCFSYALLQEQSFFKRSYNLKDLNSRILEPFYIIQELLRTRDYYLILPLFQALISLVPLYYF